jgi:hypothetical protein
MALTNRQRVEQALELLETGLLPYVEREMKSVYGAAKWETQAIAALGRGREPVRIGHARAGEASGQSGNSSVNSVMN